MKLISKIVFISSFFLLFSCEKKDEEKEQENSIPVEKTETIKKKKPLPKGRFLPKDTQPFGSTSTKTFGNETGYPITDTGLFVAKRSKVFWAGNDVLFYSGHEAGKYDYQDGRLKPVASNIYMVYELLTGNFYPLNDEYGKVNLICSSPEGFVYFDDKGVKPREYYLGKVERYSGRYSIVRSKGVVGRVEELSGRGDCTQFSHSHAKKGRKIEETLTSLDYWGGGLMSSENEQSSSLVVVGGEKTVFPFTWLSQMDIKYYPHLDSYQVVSRDLESVRKIDDKENEGEFFIYLISRDGSYSRKPISLEFYKGSSHPGRVIFSMGGMIIRMKDPRLNDRSLSDQGLFIVDEYKNISRLILGWTSIPSLSPNGCMLAFGHFSSLSESGRDVNNNVTLKIIDTCNF